MEDRGPNNVTTMLMSMLIMLTLIKHVSLGDGESMTGLGMSLVKFTMRGGTATCNNIMFNNICQRII